MSKDKFTQKTAGPFNDVASDGRTAWDLDPVALMTIMEATAEPNPSAGRDTLFDAAMAEAARGNNGPLKVLFAASTQGLAKDPSPGAKMMTRAVDKFLETGDDRDLRMAVLINRASPPSERTALDEVVKSYLVTGDSETLKMIAKARQQPPAAAAAPGPAGKK